MIEAFLEAAVRVATPLLLAALGELVVQRAGVINLGLEGAITAGAFASLLAIETGSVGSGYAAGAAGGAAVSLLLAVFVVTLRGNQIITGTALTLLALGITGTLYRAVHGVEGAALSVPTSGPVAIPGLSAIPLVGPAFFNQPFITYGLYLLVPALWWWLYRTHAGLSLRAIGESPAAAATAGVHVGRVRMLALVFGGALGGLGGATLVLAQAGTFAEGLSAGRGFIAIAIVVLGRWHPWGVALGALLFGAASALQYLFQAMGWPVPYHIFLALPYLLTLAALAGVAGRVRAPAALARD
ncbi:MAG: ABC transporter permease [Gemmatimonadaceae bacterium]|nr:ABC transporter permease [Gemmatimonadaceae bacterium]